MTRVPLPKGPCGEIIAHYASVRAEVIPSNMGTGTTVRWLVKDEDGARAFAMRLFELEPSARINPHRHPWEHEIFVLGGEGRVRVGSRWYDVGEGFFIFIPPNVEHEYVNTGATKLSFLCMIPLKPTAEDKEVKC